MNSYDFIDEVSDVPIKQFNITVKPTSSVVNTPANIGEIRGNRVIRTHDAKEVPYNFGNRATRRNVALRSTSKAKRQFHMTDKQTLYSLITAPKNERI